MNAKNFWGISRFDSSVFYYYTKDETTVTLEAANYSGSDLGLEVSLANASADFSLSESSFTVGAPGGAMGTHDFNLTFKRSGHYRDSVLVLTHSTGPGSTSDTLKILFYDSTTTMRPYLASDTLLFLDQEFGKTSCGYLHIVNPYDFPITITKIETYNNPNFDLKSSIATPITLEAHGSDSFYVCYTAPSSFGDQSVLELHFTYNGPGTDNGESYFSAIGTTKICLSVKSSIPSIYHNNYPFLPTIVGGYTDMTVTFTNNTDRKVTVTDFLHHNSAGSGDDYVTLIAPTLPMTVDAGKDMDMIMRFTPKAQHNSMVGIVWTLNIDTGADSLCNTTGWFYGYGTILSFDDTNRNMLFPAETGVLPMKSEDPSTTKVFHFINNHQTSTKVKNVYFVDGTHFSVTSPKAADLPITLKPNEELDIAITCDVAKSGYYTDSLMIVTENGLTSQAFIVEGLRTTTASVGVTENRPSITIAPNPAEDIITFRASGLTNPKIELFDILGTPIAERSQVTEWLWSARSANLPAGTYFARFSGQTVEGKPFVETKRIVLSK